MSPCASYQQQLDAAVDLGLLTRVICHELNNLLATQRGYARLLTRENALPADRQRWLVELTSAAQAQQELLATLQAHAWRLESAPASSDLAACAGDGSDSGPLPSSYAVVANALHQTGTRVPLVALTRLLAILDRAAGNDASTAGEDIGWKALGGAELALLTLDEPVGPDCTVVTLIDRSDGALRRAWDARGDTILPVPEGHALD